MKKIINLITIFLLCLSFTFALSIQESKSATEVLPGGKITLMYTPMDYIGPVAWFTGRTVPEGWVILANAYTLANGQEFAMLGLSTTPGAVEIKAPATPGQYTFTAGEWGIVDSRGDLESVTQEGTFQDFTVTVLDETPQCVSTTWDCPSFPTCGEGDVYVQRTCTDNCGDTKVETQQCESTEPTPDGESICDKVPSLAGDPTLDCIIWGVIAIFVLMFMMNMVKK